MEDVAVAIGVQRPISTAETENLQVYGVQLIRTRIKREICIAVKPAVSIRVLHVTVGAVGRAVAVKRRVERPRAS